MRLDKPSRLTESSRLEDLKILTALLNALTPNAIV